MRTLPKRAGQRFLSNQRTRHLGSFYQLLADLGRHLGGPRALSDDAREVNWPRRGVYFFQEAGERRSDTGRGPRITRVGTHALKASSGTSLWNRLSQHRGQKRSGGGNHRGSIFRLIVGTALMEKEGYHCPTWSQGSSAPRDIRESEQPLEKEVSMVVRAMPFLWLAVLDAPGPDSLRGYIERNAIALLSNSGKQPLDPPSEDWLGHRCNRPLVRGSGLWNQKHVDEAYDPAFLDTLADLINQMKKTLKTT